MYAPSIAAYERAIISDIVLNYALALRSRHPVGDARYIFSDESLPATGGDDHGSGQSALQRHRNGLIIGSDAGRAVNYSNLPARFKATFAALKIDIDGAPPHDKEVKSYLGWIQGKLISYHKEAKHTKAERNLQHRQASGTKKADPVGRAREKERKRISHMKPARRAEASDQGRVAGMAPAHKAISYNCVMCVSKSEDRSTRCAPVLGFPGVGTFDSGRPGIQFTKRAPQALMVPRTYKDICKLIPEKSSRTPQSEGVSSLGLYPIHWNWELVKDVAGGIMYD